MKKGIAILLLFCLVWGLVSCAHVQTVDLSSFFCTGKEYDLTLTLNGVESEAHLTFEDNQGLRLLFSGNQLLEGLEITLTEEGNQFSYLGMQISLEERLPAAEAIRRCLGYLSAQQSPEKTSETRNGIECDRFSFSDAENQIDFWVKKDTNSPLEIQAQIGKNSLQLQFHSTL